MKLLKYIIGILMLGTFVSCEDFFYTSVKVEPPPYKKSIVVNMYITDNDSVLRASVSRNIGALEAVDKMDLLLYDATVVVKDETGEVLGVMDTITPEQGSVVNYSLVLDSAFGGNGKCFTLEITHPDFGRATATQIMPQKPLISHPVYKLNGGVDINGDPFNQVSFILHDQAGEENFYQIKLLYKNKQEGYTCPIDIDTDDPVYARSYDYTALLLQDKTFEGVDFPVKLKAYYPDYDKGEENGDIINQAGDIPGQIFVEIKGITKDYYLYARSLQRAENAEEFGLFREPVPVYNNIENGLGIFGLCAERVELAEKEY